MWRNWGILVILLRVKERVQRKFAAASAAAQLIPHVEGEASGA